jgi:hypothetical protein
LTGYAAAFGHVAKPAAVRRPRQSRIGWIPRSHGVAWIAFAG